MAVYYSSAICAVIGHSHILTAELKCSRCGEKSLYAYKTCVVIHLSGHWCSDCEDALPGISFWDRLMLPESVITSMGLMKPSEPRPSMIPGGLYP